MASDAKRKRAPSTCPICGAGVPPNAQACPECGADERTGWEAETTRYDGLDLPDESFNEDEALKEEGAKDRISPRGMAVFWWIVGIGMTAILIYFALSAGGYATGVAERSSTKNV